MSTELINIIVASILSGGMASVITVIVRGRSDARKVDAETAAIKSKAPHEADSIMLKGAESAVTMLQQTNASVVADNQRLAVENGRLRSQLEQMELRLEQARRRAEAAERALAAAAEQLRAVQADYAEISAEMQTFRSEGSGRQ